MSHFKSPWLYPWLLNAEIICGISENKVYEIIKYLIPKYILKQSHIIIIMRTWCKSCTCSKVIVFLQVLLTNDLATVKSGIENAQVICVLRKSIYIQLSCSLSPYFLLFCIIR